MKIGTRVRHSDFGVGVVVEEWDNFNILPGDRLYPRSHKGSPYKVDCSGIVDIEFDDLSVCSFRTEFLQVV